MQSGRLLKAAVVLIILVSCIGCDQFTKQIARERLADIGPIGLMKNTILLQYVENAGAMLSLGSNLPESSRFWLLTVFAGSMLTVALFYLLFSKTLTPISVVGLSLIIGGGNGNVIDRIFNDGRVVDFMTISVGSLRTGVFNFADVAIVTGFFLLLVQYVRWMHPVEGVRQPSGRDLSL